MTETAGRDDREELRATFNTVAARYHRARPDYPDELYDMLISLAGLTATGRLLEVGGGTGKATLPLARRGFRITVVELGAELAEQGRANLAGFPGVDVVTDAFETWTPPARTGSGGTGSGGTGSAVTGARFSTWPAGSLSNNRARPGQAPGPFRMTLDPGHEQERA